MRPGRKGTGTARGPRGSAALHEPPPLADTAPNPARNPAHRARPSTPVCRAPRSHRAHRGLSVPGPDRPAHGRSPIHAGDPEPGFPGTRPACSLPCYPRVIVAAIRYPPSRCIRGQKIRHQDTPKDCPGKSGAGIWRRKDGTSFPATAVSFSEPGAERSEPAGDDRCRGKTSRSGPSRDAGRARPRRFPGANATVPGRQAGEGLLSIARDASRDCLIDKVSGWGR